jgi:2-polyprenyl-3-methyl-5-hydroxy-6-metoxy-1,4-benzoquinol methylase
MRRFSIRWKYALLKPYLDQGPLLDYGAGTGNFLREVKNHGYPVYGVEPSADARNKVASDIPIVSRLNELPNQTFQVITLWHVLEHVYSLNDTIRQLKEKLTDRGTIFIAVPNRESYDAQHYQSLWAAYDVPRHLWHFTKSNMCRLLEKEGLTVKKVIPMKLDAFYVSLLSERYKNGGTLKLMGTLQAVWTGLKSNLKGKNNTNYSSLIFVVQK